MTIRGPLRGLGAPALLAGMLVLLLAAGSASAQSPILWDQYDRGSPVSTSSYHLSSYWCVTSCESFEAADDFVVPEHQTWTVDRVEADGYFSSQSQDPPESPDLKVRFYENSATDRPGTLDASREVDVAAGAYTVTGDGDLSIPISPLSLPAGHYWLSVQAQSPLSKALWRWRPRTVVSRLGAKFDNNSCEWCNVTNSAGNPEDLVFRLRGSAPIVVGESKEQQVAMAPDGRAVFTWLRWSNGNWIVRARARAANGTLSAAQDLSAPNEDASSPRVAIDDQGDAVFTWVRSNGDNQIAQARARSAAGALSAVQNLSALGQDAAAPRVDVDNDGDAVIGWMRRDGSNWVAQARARSAAGALSGVHTLSAPGADAGNVELGVDADGDAVLVWQRAGAIQTRRRARTGTVSAIQTLSPSGSSSPQIGVDDAGNATYSWGAGPAELFTRRRTAAGTLSAAQLVTPSGGDVLNTRLDVNGAGHAVFVWESATYNGDEVFIAVKARHRAIDGTLASINTLANTGTGPQVALDAGGDAVFTWLGGGVVRARRRALNGTLSATQAVGSSGGGPRLDVDDVGNALFAWQRRIGTRNLVEGRHRAEAGAFSAIFRVSD